MATMKSVRVEKFGGPDVMNVQEIPVPTLANNQLLIKIYSAGVNPVDTYIREGTFVRMPNLPYTPGKDGAGIVKGVGSDVSNFKIGDRVFVCMIVTRGQGTYSEFAAVDEKYVFPLPESLSFDEGAALGIPYFTAYRALIIKGQAASGETVLIHGASGSVGLASVQIAKAYGLQVIGTAGSVEGMELVKATGADHVFNHKDKHYEEKIIELTENRGVNIILEMLANVNLGKDLTILDKQARVMVIGTRGTVKIDPRHLMSGESSVIGVALLSSTDREWETTSRNILRGINQGYIKPIIDKRYSLEDCGKAHRDIIESKGAKGKLIITVCEA